MKLGNYVVGGGLQKSRLLISRNACGIEMDDKFVVTGGESGGGRKKKVAVFTEAGAVTYMRNLKTGRFWHACSKFVNDDGDTVSLLY